MSTDGILIVSPHLDDEVLGCASFFQMRSDRVAVLYTTKHHPRASDDVLKKENKKLAAFLGCNMLFTRFDAINQLDALHIADVIDEFEGVITKHRPGTVVLPNPSFNQDHRAVYEAMLTALRVHDQIPFVGRVLLYEEPETFGTLRKVEPFKPTYFRQLDMEFKLEAVQIYESQMRTYRSLEHIRTIAKLRGMQANMEYAEAFEVVRWVE